MLIAFLDILRHVIAYKRHYEYDINNLHLFAAILVVKLEFCVNY